MILLTQLIYDVNCKEKNISWVCVLHESNQITDVLAKHSLGIISQYHVFEIAPHFYL